MDYGGKYFRTFTFTKYFKTDIFRSLTPIKPTKFSHRFVGYMPTPGRQQHRPDNTKVWKCLWKVARSYLTFIIRFNPGCWTISFSFR